MDYRSLDPRPQAGLLGQPALLGHRPSPAEIGTDVRRLPPAVGGLHADPAATAPLAGESPPGESTFLGRVGEAILDGAQGAARQDGYFTLSDREILEQRKPGGFFYGPVGSINEVLFVPLIRGVDSADRLGNAALFGTFSGVGQLVEEAGLGKRERVARDLYGMSLFPFIRGMPR